MKKDEYLNLFEKSLRKYKVNDLEDILDEYKQHFSFKLLDGYSEEEVASKLGDPEKVAPNFAPDYEGKKTAGGKAGRKALSKIGLFFLDIFAALFFLLLFGWALVMAILSILILTVTVLFLLRGHILPMIPPMPYTSVVSLSFVLFAIAVLVAIGCIYFGAFIRQWGKAYLRFRQNIMAQANGNAPLPALSIYPQIDLKVNRRLRNIALFALLILVASLTVTIVISQVQSGSLGFWHTWHWFEK